MSFHETAYTDLVLMSLMDIVGSGVTRSASAAVPPTATGNASGIRKPSGSFTNVKSSGYGPPRTRQ